MKYGSKVQRSMSLMTKKTMRPKSHLQRVKTRNFMKLYGVRNIIKGYVHFCPITKENLKTI